QRLPDWPEMVSYFETLAEASDRVTVENLGKTTNGEPYLVVAISAPENLTEDARQRNRDLLGRLADPRGRPETDLEEAIATAKTVAVILATQHSNEIGAALMTLDLAHQLASGDDAETRELLSKTITLLIPSANPDGIRMIVDWYRRWAGTAYEGRGMPWLYHSYVGHDNNRDWFMLTQVENQHYARLHNREHPQLVFDMHQMGRDGARFMVPPFIDPLDPNQDPVIQQGFAVLGTSIAARLTSTGKPGVATHIIFDNYSPSLAYGNYHGSIDLLSEAASCRLATPVTVEEEDLKANDGFDPKVRTWNHPMPWKGGAWTLQDIVDYDLIAARAFLDHAAKYREQLLRDYLSISRRTVQRAEPPWAFVFPADQPDRATAVELLQTLERGAVEVEEASMPFTADGVTYPEGTRVVRLEQPAGNFAKTLLEVQEYPDLRKWPGGPPVPPYDISGHTLPLQMGVRAIEIRRPLSEETIAALTPVQRVDVPPGAVRGDGTFGYAIRPDSNRATLAVQRLLTAGYAVHRATERVPGLGLPTGSILVPRAAGVDALVRMLADETGLDIVGLDGPVTVDTLEQTKVRLGIYQSWKPCIDEGWARWVLEAYDVEYETLHDADVRQGGLARRFDAILLPHQTLEELRDGNAEKNEYKEPYPPDYVGGLGDVGLDALQTFVEDGGTIIAIDAAATAVVQRFALPVRNVLDGVGETEFYCPGSLLRVVMDGSHPLG
ncbi:MAG TPA: M14 family zinc carboxypeptidase, partial [Thermomicrobiales bacterium]|nr:M14 family zinc carboxypeptidase [Thermomicrobiales bacterium]